MGGFPAVIGWDDFYAQDDASVHSSGGTLQINGASGLGQGSDSGVVLYDGFIVGGQGGPPLYLMNETGAPSSGTIDLGTLDLAALPVLDLSGTHIADESMERSFSGAQLLSPTPVPEPTTIALSAIGLAGLLARRRRSR